MTKDAMHEEIDQIVQAIFDDYNGGKNIDAIKLFSNPDKDEVRELVEHFFRIIYPGYFRDLTYKIYNPKSSFAVTIEDVFYHLKKQIYRALDYSRRDDKLTDEERSHKKQSELLGNEYIELPNSEHQAAKVYKKNELCKFLNHI